MASSWTRKTKSCLNLKTAYRGRGPSPVSFRRAFLAEHFGGEGLDAGSVLPRLGRQSCLSASLIQKGHPVPVMFDGDLWQEQPSISAHADKQSVAADFHRFRFDRLRRRKNTELNFQMGRFVQRYWREASVLKSGSPGDLGDSSVERVCAEDVADTTSQVTIQIQRCKRAARFGQMRARRIKRDLVALQRRKNRIVCQAQQQVSLLGRELPAGVICRMKVSGARSKQRHLRRLGEAAQGQAFCAG